MLTGASCQPTILPMGSWPKLIEVAMPYQDSCASRRGTADLQRWSMGTESRNGYDFVDYEPLGAAAAPASPAARLSGIRRRLKLAAAASLRLWRRLMSQRCPSLKSQSCLPFSRRC